MFFKKCTKANYIQEPKENRININGFPPQGIQGSYPFDKADGSVHIEETIL